MNRPTSHELAAHIQHTLIRPGVTSAALAAHCDECTTHGFDAAMIPAAWVPEARRLLAGTRVKVASAVDFPLGCMTSEGKVAEVRALADAGADEIDVGVQTGWLLSGDFARYVADMRAMVEAAPGIAIKVMLELPLLDAAARELAVQAAIEAGVAYAKNASSGTVGVATPEDIRFLRDRLPDSIGVKASGGIRTAEQAIALLDAGASLIGTSHGLAIIGASAAPVAGGY